MAALTSPLSVDEVAYRTSTSISPIPRRVPRMCSVMTVWQREAPRGPKVGMRRVLHDPGGLGKRVKRETSALLR